jgi:amino acid adenylation domain-containing protein
MTAIGSGSRAGRQAVRLGYAANDPALIEPAEHEAFAADAFPRAAREHPQGCSFAQEQFWFVDQLAPGNLAHSFSWPVRLRGRLDATALERAFVEVVRRHEALRTMFSLEDGQPVQVVGAHDAFRLERVDISSERDPESVAQRLVDEDTRRPFDLGRQPAFRARLIRLSENEHVLQTVVHHIVFDEWSKVLLYRELSALYAAFAEGRPSPLAEPRAQLADFAAWQRSRLTEQVLQEELDHWQQELEGAPAVLDLPSDRPRPAVATMRGSRRRFPLPPELTAALGDLAQAEGATLFDAMLAVFELLLSRHTGETDFLVGAPIDDRVRPELDLTIGVLLSTVVLRSSVSDNPSFRTLLGRVRERVVDAAAHADLPFELLVKELQPVRDLSRHPLYQVMLAINPPDPTLQLPGIEAAAIETEANGAGVDLFLFLQEHTEGFDALWEFSTDLFDPETIERLHSHLVRLLEGVVETPDLPLDELPMMREVERSRLMFEWQGREVDYPNAALHELVEAQVARTPEAVAVSFEGQELTYAELNARANQLARRLRAGGVCPDSLVAVSLERSPELVIGLLGILKAGGAYLPLDPGLPDERLSFMLADSGVETLVTQDTLLSRLPAFGGRIIRLDADWPDIAREDADDLGVAPSPDNLAYCIYTSGTTGRPKGVLNTHRGIVNRLMSMQDTYALDGTDRLLQKTQISFDVSVREVFWPLLFGARLVVAAPGEHGNPSYLAKVIEEEQVTTIHFVPSMLQLFLDETDRGALRSVRSVLSGGEALPVDLATRFMERFDCELHNLYGPTEAAVSVTAWRCDSSYDKQIVPIGRPIANTQIYLLDARLEPVPVGVWGELFVGGAQLARGYHGRPELTAERFIASPFGPGRLYRTGDLARWTADGVVEFGGRIDDQVKVRGFRVEPSEIEVVLREHDAVADSAVVAIEPAGGGPTELAAYVVLEPAQSDSSSIRADVQSLLKTKLPDYMVPASFTVLGELPLLPSGKLDRNALPRPDRSSGQEYAAPETDAERRLAELWGELLEVDRVGRRDNFFTLGGHSLLAARLVGRVSRDFGVDVPLCSFLQDPTIAVLAEQLEVEPSEPEPELPPLVPRAGGRESSFAQERFWFVDEVMGSSAAYNIPVGLRLRGELKPQVLERALSEIVRRHEILRTHFAVEEGRPLQLVVPARPVSLTVVDVSDLPAGERERSARRIVDEETQQAFELGRGPLFSTKLIRLGEDDHLLHMVFSHLVFDGVSKLVLIRELGALYDAFARGDGSPLPEVELQYGDFAEWQRSWLQGELLDRELEYWRQALDGVPSALELPTDRPRPSVSTQRGAWFRTAIPPSLVDGLESFARREGATFYMTLLAAFDALLHRYSRQDDIVVGMPVDCRDRPELDDAIGVFVDTVVLRVDLSGNVTYRELVERVRGRMLEAIAHQRLPFEQLVRALEPDRELGRHPLYQVMLTLVPSESLPQFEGLALEEIATQRASAPIDLTVFIEQRDQGVEAIWEYSTDLFDLETIERMHAHFLRLLDTVVAEPDRPIAELQLLSADERTGLIETWSGSADAYPVACLHELLEARVAAAPDAPAVVYEEDTLSYRELNERANRLAHRLRELGVGPEVPVALCLRRSLELVVAIVAVLKAGGAYVPLDPEYPAERLAFVLSDARPPVLLTQEDVLEQLPEHEATVVCLDRDLPVAADFSSANPEPLAGPENLAYVIYTSGSTGQPKGVQIEHRQVARLFTATDAWFGFGPQETWTLFHSYAFDFSVWELWGALLYGGRLVIPPLWTTRSPQALADLLAKEQVTVLNATPSLFVSVQEELIRVGDELALRCVIFGGEALQPSALRPWFKHFGHAAPTLVNMYGITETTVHVTYRVISAADCEGDASPIGEPIPDLQVYVLDDQLEPVPPGVTGELFVGGAGVARGYLNRPELNVERFLANPFGAGRLYRSGDTARQRANGELEFLGRIDDQVKIRGFRIELGEIQAALTDHEAVAESVVVASDDGTGDTRLAAYIVPSPETAGDLRSRLRLQRDGGLSDDRTLEESVDRLRGDLRELLGKKLPAFMVPASLTVLPELPLTSNGKLDRRALPAPVWEEQSDAAFTPPRTAAEIQIAAIWQDVLGLERVGVDDNFFHLGGHSLLAARVTTQVRERFSIELSVRAIFERPTLAAFAEQVAAAGGSAGEDAPRGHDGQAAAAPAGGHAYPLSFPQQQLLVIDELAAGVATYNGAQAVRVVGPLDRDALERALNGVIERHESLRTVLTWEDEQPMQVVLDEWELVLDVVDLTALSSAEREAELARRLREQAKRPFDLGRDVMLRTTLFQLAAEEHVILFIAHHSASDGWSVGVFCRDLGELYDAARTGRPAELPPLQLNYRDFAAWQRRRLRGQELERALGYWRGQLAGAPTFLPLPTDRARPAEPSFEGASLRFALPEEVAEAVLRLCRDEDVTPYMLLLSVFAILLYRQTGQDDVLVSGPFANRSRAEFDQLVGFFANTLVIRVRLAGNPKFRDLLARVRATVLEAFDHQDVPFELIVDAVRPKRELGINPLAQVNFRVRVDRPATGALSGATTTRVPVDEGFAGFDLAFDLLVVDEGITAEVIYNTDLFDAESIERIAADYERLLRQILTQPEAQLLSLELPSEQQTAVASSSSLGPSIRRFRQTGSGVSER